MTLGRSPPPFSSLPPPTAAGSAFPYAVMFGGQSGPTLLTPNTGAKILGKPTLKYGKAKPVKISTASPAFQLATAGSASAGGWICSEHLASTRHQSLHASRLSVNLPFLPLASRQCALTAMVARSAPSQGVPSARPAPTPPSLTSPPPASCAPTSGPTRTLTRPARRPARSARPARPRAPIARHAPAVRHLAGRAGLRLALLLGTFPLTFCSIEPPENLAPSRFRTAVGGGGSPATTTYLLTAAGACSDAVRAQIKDAQEAYLRDQPGVQAATVNVTCSEYLARRRQLMQPRTAQSGYILSITCIGAGPDAW
jgi:hypothetical protein